MAPEVIKKKYTQQCDLWSIGIIAYILISGCPPYNGSTEGLIMAEIEKGTRLLFQEACWQDVSQDAQQFIKALLQRNPTQRLSAKQALSHKWIRKYNNIHKN